MAKKVKAKKPRKVNKRGKRRKPGIPEPDISAVSDYVAETS